MKLFLLLLLAAPAISSACMTCIAPPDGKLVPSDYMGSLFPAYDQQKELLMMELTYGGEIYESQPQLNNSILYDQNFESEMVAEVAVEESTTVAQVADQD